LASSRNDNVCPLGNSVPTARLGHVRKVALQAWIRIQVFDAHAVAEATTAVAEPARGVEVQIQLGGEQSELVHIFRRMRA
jgi:hypothetical protein